MKTDRIAVIGERELVLGFKLLGIRNVFIASDKDVKEIFIKLMISKSYDLMLLSEDAKDVFDGKTLYLAESSLKPIVIFIPSLIAHENYEPLEVLVKRILGVEIWATK
jgi:V/A-type H+-transporting ATPase subunit F